MRFFELIRAFLNDWKAASKVVTRSLLNTVISWKIGVTVFRHIPFLGNNIARSKRRSSLLRALFFFFIIVSAGIIKDTV